MPLSFFLLSANSVVAFGVPSLSSRATTGAMLRTSKGSRPRRTSVTEGTVSHTQNFVMSLSAGSVNLAGVVAKLVSWCFA